MSTPAEELAELARPLRHEANNLLAALLGTIDLVARVAATERERERAARMRTAAERLEALLRGYLALAAPPEMRGGTDGAQVLALMRPLLGLLTGPGGQVEVSAEAGLPRLAVPVAEMQTILLAMARTAAEAAPPGCTLRVALAAAPGGAELSVATAEGSAAPPRLLAAAPG